MAGPSLLRLRLSLPKCAQLAAATAAAAAGRPGQPVALARSRVRHAQASYITRALASSRHSARLQWRAQPIAGAKSEKRKPKQKPIECICRRPKVSPAPASSNRLHPNGGPLRNQMAGPDGWRRAARAAGWQVGESGANRSGCAPKTLCSPIRRSVGSRRSQERPKSRPAGLPFASRES